MRLAKTYGYLKKDLDRIEATLNSMIQAKHVILDKASTQLLRAGGKRIRPVFVLLASQFGQDTNKDEVINAAVSIELIHMATLVHDDVIDHASLRRGKPTIREQYDNRVAMYTGDYILACALESVTKIKNPKLHKLLSKTIVEVCIGEIEQIKEKFDWEQNIRNYLRRIKRKTAILIATCCKMGAILAGLSDNEANALYKYGYNVGMSFQVIDDILDFTSTERQLGKPVGNDLLQGNITYPVLAAMDDESFSELVRSTFHDPENVSKVQFNEVIDKMKQLKAIDAAYELSERYLRKALNALKGFTKQRSKETLIDIAQYIGKRRA